MNKKGQFEVITITIILFIIFIIFGGIFMVATWNVSYQSGTSKDKVMGYDVGPIWNHAYLMNDHFTVYCFDNDNFKPIFEEAQRNQKEVIVSYKKYMGRGSLCTSSQTYEPVIVTNVEIVK